MAAAPYLRNIGGDKETSKATTKEFQMFTSPDTFFDLAKLHQKELIAEAERSRLLSRARRTRTKRSERSHR
jgi:hypothetical protein